MHDVCVTWTCWLKREFKGRFQGTFLDQYTVEPLRSQRPPWRQRNVAVVERWPVYGRLGCNMTPVVFEECNNKITRAAIGVFRRECVCEYGCFDKIL